MLICPQVSMSTVVKRSSYGCVTQVIVTSSCLSRMSRILCYMSYPTLSTGPTMASSMHYGINCGTSTKDWSAKATPVRAFCRTDTASEGVRSSRCTKLGAWRGQRRRSGVFFRQGLAKSWVVRLPGPGRIFGMSSSVPLNGGTRHCRDAETQVTTRRRFVRSQTQHRGTASGQRLKKMRRMKRLLLKHCGSSCRKTRCRSTGNHTSRPAHSIRRVVAVVSRRRDRQAAAVASHPGR